MPDLKVAKASPQYFLVSCYLLVVEVQRPQSGTTGNLACIYTETPLYTNVCVQRRLLDVKVTTAAPFYLLTTCYPLVDDVQRPKSGTTGT